MDMHGTFTVRPVFDHGRVVAWRMCEHVFGGFFLPVVRGITGEQLVPLAFDSLESARLFYIFGAMQLGCFPAAWALL